MKFIKGKDYQIDTMELFAEENNFDTFTYGTGVIGHDFLVIEDTTKDCVISFVLTGVMGNKYVYTCIYSDL